MVKHVRFGLCVVAYYACRVLHSFPTRRSSDLPFRLAVDLTPTFQHVGLELGARLLERDARGGDFPVGALRFLQPFRGLHIEEERSEEHTSELQSRFDLVCRLLLETKNVHGRDS